MREPSEPTTHPTIVVQGQKAGHRPCARCPLLKLKGGRYRIHVASSSPKRYPLSTSLFSFTTTQLVSYFSCSLSFLLLQLTTFLLKSFKTLGVCSFFLLSPPARPVITNPKVGLLPTNSFLLFDPICLIRPYSSILYISLIFSFFLNRQNHGC